MDIEERVRRAGPQVDPDRHLREVPPVRLVQMLPADTGRWVVVDTATRRREVVLWGLDRTGEVVPVVFDGCVLTPVRLLNGEDCPYLEEER